MNTITATSAGGVIIDDRSNVVLTSRRSFKGELQWGLPKGTVEEGEEPIGAALREAHEETGLDVELLGHIDRIDYWYVQPESQGQPSIRVHKFVHYFLMRAVGGDPSLHDDETEEVVFLPPSQAIQKTSFKSERKVIEAAVEKARSLKA